jgi:hypothetical protein
LLEATIGAKWIGLWDSGEERLYFFDIFWGWLPLTPPQAGVFWKENTCNQWLTRSRCLQNIDCR